MSSNSLFIILSIARFVKRQNRESHEAGAPSPAVRRKLHGGQEAADAGGAQVVDLVDLQHRVELAGALQDLIHLVSGDGVQAAAESV